MSVEVGTWISIDDLLPQFDTPVLVFIPDVEDYNPNFTCAKMTGINEYKSKAVNSREIEWVETAFSASCDEMYFKPTHWMPLPAPPTK